MNNNLLLTRFAAHPCLMLHESINMHMLGTTCRWQAEDYKYIYYHIGSSKLPYRSRRLYIQIMKLSHIGSIYRQIYPLRFACWRYLSFSLLMKPFVYQKVGCKWNVEFCSFQKLNLIIARLILVHKKLVGKTYSKGVQLMRKREFQECQFTRCDLLRANYN